MSILSAHGLAKYYGAQDVFADIGFDVAHGDKIALVGPNGAGKTTLLRIILGVEEPSAGSITRAHSLRCGYLPQHATFPSEQTLHEEMLSVFADLRRQQERLLALTDRMARHPGDAGLVEEYGAAEARFEREGGYAYHTRIARVLGGLGFSDDMYNWPIAVLSGGQITRALLAKLLLQEPGMLILDEPTNYLDLDALEWLESYLQNWPETLLIVSHDRYFLDHVVTRVWELEHGRLNTYRGNYTSYVTQRKARRLRLQREYEAQQEHIAKTEDFIRRYGAGQRSREAKGRQKRLDRLERIEAPQTLKQMRWRLGPAVRSGDQVLIGENPVIGYASRPEEVAAPTKANTGERADERHVLIRCGEFLIQRGQCVALLGPNGSGKTTLIKTVLGETPALEGRIRTGASVHIGYLPQTQSWLDSSLTVLKQIMVESDLTIEGARSHLGRFLFSGDEVDKRIADLSGGELARVALALLTLDDANVLLLDEPTTHLDVQSQEVLQDILTAFDGTILFISHDRYLIDALATHVWYVREGRLYQYEGNYTDFVRARQAEMAQAGGDKVQQTPRHETNDRAAQRRERRILALEQEIAEIEARLDEMPMLINQASERQDIAQVAALGSEYESLTADLHLRMGEWERVASDHVQ